MPGRSGGGSWTTVVLPTHGHSPPGADPELGLFCDHLLFSIGYMQTMNKRKVAITKEGLAGDQGCLFLNLHPHSPGVS